MAKNREVLPKIVWLLSLVFSRSYRVRYLISKNPEDGSLLEGPIIYVFWHGRHFFVYHLFRSIMGKKTAVLVSPSRDGRRIAILMKRSGFEIIHGSSHRSPVKALAQTLRWLRQGGELIATVDGPKGPAEVAKPGAVYLAKKTGAWIVPLSFSARRKIRLRSWDRFLIPFPLTQVLIIGGKPYRLDPGLRDEEIEKARLDLERKLKELSLRADGYWGKKPRISPH